MKNPTDAPLPLPFTVQPGTLYAADPDTPDPGVEWGSAWVPLGRTDPAECSVDGPNWRLALSDIAVGYPVPIDATTASRATLGWESDDRLTRMTALVRAAEWGHVPFRSAPASAVWPLDVVLDGPGKVSRRLAARLWAVT